MRLLALLFFTGLALVVIALVLVVIALWPPKMGIDFGGGVQLVYQVAQKTFVADDQANASPEMVDWSNLVQALEARIDPSSTQDVVVRRYGEWQVEIVIPRTDADELKRIESIEKRISAAGVLEFRIVAKRDDPRHASLVALAEEQSRDPDKRLSKRVMDGYTIVGYWARVGRVGQTQERDTRNAGALRAEVAGDVIRDARTGELIQLPTTFNAIEKHALERFLIEDGIAEIDLLVIVDRDLELTGDDLSMVACGYDEMGLPCVNFRMAARGAERMAAGRGKH